MEITAEIKKVLEEQKKQCPFCKIIAGEIPATKVYEDDKVIAIMDINPIAEGHLLLLPKEHYPILPYLSGELFNHLFKIAKELAFCVQKSLVKTGCCILIQNGAVAGQNSPHFMVHIIPREKGDGVLIFNLSGNEIPGDVEPIKHNLNIMMENHFSRNPVDWHKPKEIQEQRFTKEQVLGIIEKNPALKKIMQDDANSFKSQINSNPQLKSLFADVDIDDILMVVNGERKAEIIGTDENGSDNDDRKAEPKDDAMSGTKDSRIKGKKEGKRELKEKRAVDLDDIARLF